MFLPIFKSSKIVLKNNGGVRGEAKVSTKTELIIRKTLEIKYNIFLKLEDDWLLRKGRLYIPEFLLPK